MKIKKLEWTQNKTTATSHSTNENFWEVLTFLQRIWLSCWWKVTSVHVVRILGVPWVLRGVKGLGRAISLSFVLLVCWNCFMVTCTHLSSFQPAQPGAQGGTNTPAHTIGKCQSHLYHMGLNFKRNHFGVFGSDPPTMWNSKHTDWINQSFFFVFVLSLHERLILVPSSNNKPSLLVCWIISRFSLRQL